MSERIGTCATCAFWHDVNGQCRAHPPNSNGWPHVDSNDWCGDYYDGRREGVKHTYDRLVNDGHVTPHTWYIQHRNREDNDEPN